MSFVLYECRSVRENKPLCSLGLKFTETQSLRSHFGRIETALIFNNPENNTDRLHRHTNTQSWYKNPDDEYHMGITHFSLPPFLQGVGLGPVIWSEIFKGLPDSIKGVLRISGSLNSGDAYTPQTDTDGRFTYETVNGLKKVKLLNQIKRRNRFWSSMIAPIEKNSPSLTCDSAGNGAFKGIFKDPVPSTYTDKISLKTIKFKQNKPANNAA